LDFFESALFCINKKIISGRKAMNNKTIKEPIRKKWIWIAVIILFAGNVPWYLPVGRIKPIIFGFPFWAFVSLLFSLAFCGLVSWVCLKEWNVVEDQEEEGVEQ
jgi:uncharacterized membrane protein